MPARLASRYWRPALLVAAVVHVAVMLISFSDLRAGETVSAAFWFTLLFPVAIVALYSLAVAGLIVVGLFAFAIGSDASDSGWIGLLWGLVAVGAIIALVRLGPPVLFGVVAWQSSDSLLAGAVVGILAGVAWHYILKYGTAIVAAVVAGGVAYRVATGIALGTSLSRQLRGFHLRGRGLEGVFGLVDTLGDSVSLHGVPIVLTLWCAVVGVGIAYARARTESDD